MSCQCAECIDSQPHLSDCAVHNEPALPKGPCDCRDTYVPSIMDVEGSNGAEWVVCNYLEADDIRFRGTFAECETFLAAA